MSYVKNDPADFAAESAAGFVAAHRDLVRKVPGGVARRTATPDGQVAVVIGGGSGHYPAFAGLVGQGLAHAAAMGNVFASPSTQQVYGAAKSVATDAGVLLSYGNYAGDVLNFDQAEERLRAEGIPCRTVRVTDDVASAGAEEWEKRRGIAGDLTVFRAAGWAAAQGRDLDGVYALANHANERTRSLGVAFSGCTLPGADAPLFTVPDGLMEVGMGIHGEPGIETRPLLNASGLADLLVDALLAEVPASVVDISGRRVAVILNGLGAVKNEELFVVYDSVATRLESAGLTIVEPEVGEVATSFEMAGISLTLLWLDDELEAAWTSPVYTPGYRKGPGLARVAATGDSGASAGTAPGTTGGEILPDVDDAMVDDELAAASQASLDSVSRVVAALAAIDTVIDEQAEALGQLDAIAGDGDHGIGMQRGARAAHEAALVAADRGAGSGSVLVAAGDAWADKAGGTSGALWGAGLRAIGQSIGDDGAPGPAEVARAVGAAREAVVAAGKAAVGDKTLVDALVPFADILASAAADGVGLAAGWTSAARAATDAAQATADLEPKLGRARPHVAKSLGTPDPGAVSLGMAVTAVAAAFTDIREQGTKETS